MRRKEKIAIRAAAAVSGGAVRRALAARTPWSDCCVGGRDWARTLGPPTTSAGQTRPVAGGSPTQTWRRTTRRCDSERKPQLWQVKLNVRKICTGTCGCSWIHVITHLFSGVTLSRTKIQHALIEQPATTLSYTYDMQTATGIYNPIVNGYRLRSCNPGETLTGRDGDKSITLSDAVSLSNQCFDRIKGQARIARVIVWPEIRHQLRRVRAVDVEQMPVHLAKPTANTNHNRLHERITVVSMKIDNQLHKALIRNSD